MINTINTIFNKTKLFLLILLMLVFTSCGSFNSSGFTSNDGIYTKNKSNVDNNSNTNGLYYKDYFDQKAQEYGLNTETNDSIITDINSYSSTTNTNVVYNTSYGSWGDNPDSVNINFRDRNFIGAYWNSYYSPFYMNSWYMSPWDYNFFYPFYSYGYYPYGYYPYGRYGRYSYWDYIFRPYYGYGGYGYNNHYNERYNDRSTAYMNGTRGSESRSISNSKLTDPGKTNDNNSIGNRDISNYNVGRNEADVNGNSNNEKSSSDEISKSRNISRVYYALKNSVGNSNSIRGYQNQGEINNGGGSGSKNNNNIRSYATKSKGNSNFQLSRRSSNENSSNTRSYDVSRTSNGTKNSSNSNSRSYNVSRSSINSNTKSSYSPPSRSSSSSSSSRSSSSAPPVRASSGVSRGSR